jgi:hypothetical protein
MKSFFKKISIFSIIHNPLMLVLLLILTEACSTMQTYEGEKLPEAEVARIQVTTAGGLHRVHGITFIVNTVDGVKPGFSDSYVEILPGYHHLEVGVIKTTQWMLALAAKAVQKSVILDPWLITFEAVAGCRYRVNGTTVPDEKYEKWALWVENVESGEVVGGRKP